MEVVELQTVLVALTPDEIDTIISGLTVDFYEWDIKEAGILLFQFEKLKKKLGYEE